MPEFHANQSARFLELEDADAARREEKIEAGKARNEKLARYSKIGLALIAGAAAAWAFEKTDVPQTVYDYHRTRGNLSTEYYGSWGALDMASDYIRGGFSRAFLDCVAFGAGFGAVYKSLSCIQNKIKKIINKK